MNDVTITTNPSDLPKCEGFNPFLPDSLQPATYVANSGLLKDEHRAIEQVITKTIEPALDFYAAFSGFVQGPFGLGTTLVTRERRGNGGKASVTMDPEVMPRNQSTHFDEVNNYIPIISSAWSKTVRHDAATQGGRSRLSTAKAEISAAAIGKTLEDIALDGRPDVVQGAINYGLRTHPDRNTQSITTWVGKSGEDIVADVRTALQMLFVDLKKGPFDLFICKEYNSVLTEDYSAVKGDNTVGDRILALPGVRSIKTSFSLDPGEYMLLSVDSETADVLMGQGIRNTQWGASPLTTQFLIWTAQGFRVKSDMLGRSGIVHATV